MKDLLFFEGMITPKLITLLYWLLLAAALIAGLATMFGGGGGAGFLMGLGIMIGGGLGARIACELIIVLFKINDHARRVAETGTPAAQQPAA